MTLDVFSYEILIVVGKVIVMVVPVVPLLRIHFNEDPFFNSDRVSRGVFALHRCASPHGQHRLFLVEPHLGKQRQNCRYVDGYWRTRVSNATIAKYVDGHWETREM